MKQQRIIEAKEKELQEYAERDTMLTEDLREAKRENKRLNKELQTVNALAKQQAIDIRDYQKGITDNWHNRASSERTETRRPRRAEDSSAESAAV